MSCAQLESNGKEKTSSDVSSAYNKTASLKRNYTPNINQTNKIVTSVSNIAKQMRITPEPVQKKPARPYTLTKSRRDQKHLSESSKWMEPDEDGDTDLHIVLTQDSTPRNTEIAELIIDNVARPQALDMRNKQGLTPIIVAVLQGLLSLVIRLRVAGANPNITDGYGNTPLHHAVCKNNQGTVKALLIRLLEEDICVYCSDPKQHQRYRTNLNAKNCDGKTPLFLAVERHNTAILRFLLGCGADPNVFENCAGRTALHSAVESADLACIEELLKSKSTDVNANTYAGRTPLDMAQNLTGQAGQKIISKLQEHGAMPGVESDDN